MAYKGLWVLRGQFGCKFQFGSGPNLWGMEAHGLQEVWVMRVSTADHNARVKSTSRSVLPALVAFPS